MEITFQFTGDIDNFPRQAYTDWLEHHTIMKKRRTKCSFTLLHVHGETLFSILIVARRYNFPDTQGIKRSVDEPEPRRNELDDVEEPDDRASEGLQGRGEEADGWKAGVAGGERCGNRKPATADQSR